MLSYYAHTVTTSFKVENLNLLKEILDTGYLLSRRKLLLSEEVSGFNGMDYISLCDLDCIHENNSAYYLYFQRGLSLLFSKELKVLKTNYFYLDRRSLDYGKRMHELGNGIIRYSDLKDEVQLKDKISLEYLKGISLSLKRMQEDSSKDEIKKYLLMLEDILNKYEIDVPVYNLDNEKIIIKK